MSATSETGPSAAGASRPAAEGGLLVTGLKVNYGGVQAVRGVSFRVAPGEAVGIIGANGAGKSSTLKATLGLIKRSVDSIEFNGSNLAKVNARHIIRHGIGYVPEGRKIFGGLSVEKNLLLGAYNERWNEETKARVQGSYDIFPVLGQMKNRLAGALSGGQQQMLAIARALMSEPKLLVLDEPSMGLSPKLVDEVLDVIQRLTATGMGILLVEQNAKLTFEATTHCFVMENGEFVMDGPADDLRHDAQVRRIYLGI
jgi:branched-chain amino acid transport system ATP-binding protein